MKSFLMLIFIVLFSISFPSSTAIATSTAQSESQSNEDHVKNLYHPFYSEFKVGTIFKKNLLKKGNSIGLELRFEVAHPKFQ